MLLSFQQIADEQVVVPMTAIVPNQIPKQIQFFVGGADRKQLRKLLAEHPPIDQP
jgi:hypothetical protein